MAGAISGKYAEASLDGCNMLEFESWTLDYGPNLEEYNARSGGGAGQSVPGVITGSGTVTGFIDTLDPLAANILSGALVALILRETLNGKKVWSGNVRFGKQTNSADRGGAPMPRSLPFITQGLGSYSPT